MFPLLRDFRDQISLKNNRNGGDLDVGKGAA